MEVAIAIPNPETWIEEFRRLPFTTKHERYESLLEEHQLILREALVGNVLTIERIKQAIVYNDSYSENRSSTLHLKWMDYLRSRPVSEVIAVLQIYDAPPVSNLDQIEMSMSDVAKYFEYGVYKSFASGRKFPISATNAWLFGVSWGEMILPLGYHFRSFDERGCMSIENWKLFVKYYPWQSPRDGDRSFCNYRELQDTLQNLIEIPPVASSIIVDGFEFDKSRDRRQRIDIFLEELSQQGVIFNCPLPVYHLNHVRFIPKYYRFMHTTIGVGMLSHQGQSKLTLYLQSFKQQHLPYPHFHCDSWALYPKPLKSVIFMMLCLMRCRKDVFPLGKDVTINILLNYVVFNFHLAAEEELTECKTLGEAYTHKHNAAMRNTATDCRMIFTGGDKGYKELPYRLAAFNLGYVGVVDTDTDFIENAKRTVKSWKSFRKFLASDQNRFHDGSKSPLEILLKTCYDHEIALTLFQKGKVKALKNGEIVDLDRAKALSVAKRAKYEADFSNMRLEGAERSVKRSKIL